LLAFDTNAAAGVRITLFSSPVRAYFVTTRLIRNKTEPDTTNVMPKTLNVCRLHLKFDVDVNEIISVEVEFA